MNTGFVRRVFAVARSWPYAAALTIILTFTGLLASIYAPEIKSSRLFSWWHPEHPARFFWITLACGGALFALRQSATDQSQHSARKELRDATDNLEHLIRTMPPAEFLAYFESVYRNCYAARLALVDCHDAEVFGAGIRQLLRGLALMARHFDGDDESLRYAANIMVFTPCDEMSATDWTRVRAELLYDSKFHRDELIGVLRLLPELSTSVDSRVKHQAAVDKDERLSIFALAVPKEPRTLQGRWRILPGAPIAFETKNADVYSDTSKIKQWCDEQGDFTEETKAKLQGYFAPGPEQWIGSFVSLPLKDERDNLVGVVNVHRNTPGLLKNDMAAAIKHFVPLAGPVQTLLAGLVRDMLLCKGAEVAHASMPDNTTSSERAYDKA